MTLASFVPGEQQEKLAFIGDVAKHLAPVLTAVQCRGEGGAVSDDDGPAAGSRRGERRRARPPGPTPRQSPAEAAVRGAGCALQQARPWTRR